MMFNQKERCSMPKRLILALAGLVLVSPLRAQSPQRDSLLSHLIGRWVLRGPWPGRLSSTT
jgi:hypothetical protein